MPVEEWPTSDAIRGQQKKTKSSGEVEHDGEDEGSHPDAPEKLLKRKATGKEPMPPPPEKKAKPTKSKTSGKLKIGEEAEQRRRAVIESSDSDVEDTIPLSQKFGAKRSEEQSRRPITTTDTPRR